MENYRLIVSDGLNVNSTEEALNHIGVRMLAEGVVKESYPAALLEREASYPTGIVLEEHVVAIPHCEAIHAKSPAIYLIRPAKPVPFTQADDDGQVLAELIIALVVTHPQEQLKLLKALFGQLQQPDFIKTLLRLPEHEVSHYFNESILLPAV